MRAAIMRKDALDDIEFELIGAADSDLGGRMRRADGREQGAQSSVRIRNDLGEPEHRVNRVVETVITIGKEDMSAHLAGEERIFFLHLCLDERVARFPEDRASTARPDVVVERLGAFDL